MPALLLPEEQDKMVKMTNPKPQFESASGPFLPAKQQEPRSVSSNVKKKKNKNVTHLFDAKMCCDKNICDGCAWSTIRTAHLDKKLQCPFCRTNAKSEAGFFAELFKKADFSEVGAAAMFEFGGFYHRRSHGFPKDVKKGTKNWTYL